MSSTARADRSSSALVGSSKQQDLRIEGQRPDPGRPAAAPAGQCRGRGIQAHTGQSHAVEQGACLVVGQLGLGYP